ncbi:MAG: single-stranded-DNA-specific exonuclease RecJ [Bacteriovoracaceae bacterium]|nr:single-stranded-DNA-specific exonuclease RecJ [Bacteriovoracaceae bacterium]
MTEKTLHPALQRLLEKRGHTGAEAQEFLSWNLKEIPDLTKMIDMEKAAIRLIDALNRNEKIAVYGDYDVDGTTSCALLWHFFKMFGVEIEVFQPSRFVEGYGIHPISIDNALESGVKVLISVDCGISNVATAQYALEKNIDLIITDHHRDAAEIIPPAYAVVNPNRRDEPVDSPLRPLAGVGVAFALAVKMRELLIADGKTVPSVYPLLPFVAVGTICDLAVLTPVNLRLCRHGLKQIPTCSYPGLLQFFAPEELAAGVTSEKISFNIGPMINSKGRLDHPERALKLLIAQTREEAREHYQHLEISNRDRRMIQAEVVEGAKEEVRKNITDNLVANVVYRPDWHEGVVGIVASKLVDAFHVPAVVLTNAEEEGIVKGSARAAGEMNIFECLEECKDLFIKFGGHKAAAGLSLKKENVPAFQKRFKEVVARLPEVLRTRAERWDVELKPEEITPQLVRDLTHLEPFGNGNERPVFRMSGVKLASYRILKDAHVKWTFSPAQNPQSNFAGISFNYLGKWNEPSPDEVFQKQGTTPFTLQFGIGINRFNGNESIQLQVERIIL